MKRIIVLAFLSCFVVTLGGCKKPSDLGSSRGDRAEIRVAYAPVVLNVPLYFGLDRGVFEKNGLKVDPKVFTSANDMINAVIADQVDAVTGVSLVPVLNLEARHPGRVRVVLHSKMTDDQPFDGLIVKADAQIHSLGDLKGRKIGLFPGTTALNLMKAFLKKEGVDNSAVEFVQLPPASHISALQSGAIDALLAYEPTLTTLLLQGGFRRIHGSIYAAMQNPSPISSTIIARRYEREHPRGATLFVKSLDEVLSIIRSDPAAAKLAMSNYTKITTEVAPHVSLVPDTLSTETDEANLQTFIDFMVEIGELPKRIDAKDLLAPTK